MKNEKQLKTKMVAIKNGRGEIKGYIKMYRCSLGWVTVPGGDE